jgi:hypothetical protein
VRDIAANAVRACRHHGRLRLVESREIVTSGTVLVGGIGCGAVRSAEQRVFVCTSRARGVDHVDKVLWPGLHIRAPDRALTHPPGSEVEHIHILCGIAGELDCNSV